MERLFACEIADKIRDGGLTVEQLSRCLLKRIQDRSDIAAWVHLDESQVLKAAQQLDSVPADQRGPLFGIPVGVKDLFYTSDMPTCFGSSNYNNHLCDIDAAIVTLLRKAGCLLMGKTVTTDLAMTMNGKDTKNPHNLAHSPGGSSSGSAAAVADYHVPVSIGTQTFGSIVRPASFCGIYGFKPTWEVISLQGCKGFCKSLDTIGFFARSMNDIQLLAGQLKLPENPREAIKAPLSIRIGWCRSPTWPKASPDAVAALEAAIRALQSRNIKCKELVLPTEFDQAPAWFRTIATKELSINIQAERKPGANELDDMLLSFVKEGEGQTWNQYRDAVDGYATLRPKFDALAKQYDAVLTLSAPGEAPEGLTWTGDSSFNVMWTALHVPALNLPGFGGRNGMPVGISLVAPRYCDMHLLDVAKHVSAVFEAEGSWKSQM